MHKKSGIVCSKAKENQIVCKIILNGVWVITLEVTEFYYRNAYIEDKLS